MNLIQDLSLTVGEQVYPNDRSNNDVSIFGDVVHISCDELLSKYHTMDLKDFTTSEALYSCGNYILVDQKTLD